MNEENKNYANRFAAILGIAILVNLFFYRLPDTVFDIPVKKVDLLSDIRVPAQNDSDDSGLMALSADGNRRAERDSTHTAPDNEGHNADCTTLSLPVIPDNQKQPNVSSGVSKTAGSAGGSSGTSTAAGLPDVSETSSTPRGSGTSESAGSTVSSDALPGTADANKNSQDNLITSDIEDFTSRHNGLHRFFTALNNIDQLGRPVRIAFVGDSFIEGDILVADFRAKMQEQFGGRGVGFIPITSVTAQYRPTVKQSANGWNSYSIIKDRNRKYVLSGFQFEPASNDASLQFQTVDMYPGLEEVSSLKFIYSKNEASDMILKNDDETYSYTLPPTEIVTQFELNGSFTKGTLQFKNSKGLKAIGIALEDNHGVVVDNFALRGNSGIVMSDLDSESCRDLQQIRPYDLIVLQYGLNVASDSVREYSWYRNRMVAVIEHIQHCFPGADILILGVSDRSRNGHSTMPAVVSLHRAQRQLAESAEVAFWSIFAAMGGQDSMIKYVNSNWASKDYTHLSFRGGREIAYALYDAIINEKGLYDSNENWVE